MNVLVVVESPAKAKTIQKYMAAIFKNARVTVLASYGHIRDIPPSGKDAIDRANGYKMSYVPIQGKHKTIKALRDAVRKSDTVYIAADPDREGESIAWHVKDALGIPESGYSRITFHEITPTAIAHALQHPTKIDMDMVCAQQTRRGLDRLFGYDITAVLWKFFHYRAGSSVVSAGRVQSAALKLIADREGEIAAFKPACGWAVQGWFGEDTVGGLVSPDVSHMPKNTLIALMQGMPGSYTVKSAETSKRTLNPPPPYITSSLQQDGHAHLGMGLARTMKAAQELYERGHITYMRTDSHAMSDDAVRDARGVIERTYGAAMYHGRRTKRSQKHAQEAHECIRPTRVSESAVKGMSSDATRLYAMVWKRTIASLMVASTYHETQVRIGSEGIDFAAVSKTLRAPGWEVVYDRKPEPKAKLPAPGDPMTLSRVQGESIWARPKGRYSEASIVKKMEANGIGRPSTYASILQKLLDKQMVRAQDVQGPEVEWVTLVRKGPARSKIKQTAEVKPMYKEQSKLVPTEGGMAVHGFMDAHFRDLIDPEFTKGMEMSLDDVAAGKTTYASVMKRFDKSLAARIATVQAQKPAADQKQAIREKDLRITCDGVEYTLRHARYGAVIQHTPPGATKPVYVGIKGYLKSMKKGLESMTEQDIRFVMSLPARLCPGMSLKLGPYGLYVQHDGANVKVFPGEYRGIVRGDRQSWKSLCERIQGKTKAKKI